MNNQSGRRYGAGPAGVRDRDCHHPIGDPMPARDRSVFDPATQSIVLAPIFLRVGQSVACLFVAVSR